MVDPEPVTVTVGEPDWAGRARVADIVLGTVACLADADAVCTELLERYPGLAVVAVRAPGRRIVIGTRDEVPDADAMAAAAVYFSAAAGPGAASR